MSDFESVLDAVRDQFGAFFKGLLDAAPDRARC